MVYLCYVDGALCAIYDNIKSANEYIESWKVLEQEHEYKIDLWNVRS